MPTLPESYPGMIAALADRHGQVGPGIEESDPFARITATALGLSVEPRKAGAALSALREAGLLDPAVLAEVDPIEITDIAREAGAALPAQGVRTLQRLARWVVERHQGSVDALAEAATGRLREELLAIRGVGEASADAILLFALRRPTYPVDRASYRILIRHGWLDPTASYEEASDTLERLAPDDAEALARLSVWLERTGRESCRATVARCDQCPLKPFLPEGGPLSPDV